MQGVGLKPIPCIVTFLEIFSNVCQCCDTPEGEMGNNDTSLKICL